jgi:nitronate monooxygenase
LDMSISTPLTALLGITHPILSAPMDVIAGARLTAAVSAAGGFGILGGGYGDQAWLEQETAKLQDVSAPFGIGFITWSLAKRPELMDIALAARPRAIMLSFGDPKPFATKIKSSGALLICQVQDEGMALTALDAGADLLIAQGSEAGGHGASRTTIDIVPAIVDLVAGRVPVAAAGGIGDGRGLAAMMMLGAAGVLLGTRFYASQECDGADEAKKRDQRQQHQEHHLRYLPKQCLAGAVQRPLPDQWSRAPLDRARGRTDAKRHRGRGRICRRESCRKLRRRCCDRR